MNKKTNSGELATTAPHPDDLAVDRFAEAMKAKMAASRAKGRGGWDDAGQCTMGTLGKMLVDHVAKGDPVDIGNFAMMLHQREAMAAEHHPCYIGDAARVIKLALTPSPAVQGQEGETITITRQELVTYRNAAFSEGVIEGREQAATQSPAVPPSDASKSDKV